MDDDDRVSIIVPTRNRRDWLRDALRSVREQSWPQVEMVVVDEASTDPTVAMVETEFPGARIVRHKKPRGPSGARNAGVAASSGRWILFLDDDDLLHPRHIEDLVVASRAAPAGCVVSGRWRRFSVVDGELRLGPIECAKPDRPALDMLADILEPMGEGSICGHSLLWPRALLRQVRWDERLSANGDSDFFGRTILAGAQIVGRPVGMAYYRVHQAERVSSATALRRPLSSAQYRLKWSQLLLARPDHEKFAEPMRNGFMALLIALSGLPEARHLVPSLRDAYALWGGEDYFVANPPSNPVKRVLAMAALKVAGPTGLHWLLKQASQPSRLDHAQVAMYEPPATEQDHADAAILRGFL